MFWTGSKQFVFGAATLAVLVVLVVGLIVFFGGIGQPAPGPALQPTPLETDASAITTDDDLPLGTYAITITKEDKLRLDIAGTWELTLAEGNRFSFAQMGMPVTEGRYSLTPDHIVFTDEKGPYGADTCIDLGTYKWAFDGQVLTLTTVEDECSGRNDVITAHPWTKQD